MKEELLEKARELHVESEELEERISFIDQQSMELGQMLSSLNGLEVGKSHEGLSSLGKGLFVKSKIYSENVFVDVGAGVIIAKSPSEIKAIINGQIEGLKSMRGEIITRLAQLRNNLEAIIERVDSENKGA